MTEDRTPVDVAGLRAAAEAATPGPWIVGWTGISESLVAFTDGLGEHGADTRTVTSPHEEGGPGSCETDAAFIAAADPTTVLALLDERDDLAARLATAEADLARLGEAVVDTCWKATPMGERADGDIHAYILPKGTVHRLIGAAQSCGIRAAFRVIAPLDPDAPTGHDGQGASS